MSMNAKIFMCDNINTFDEHRQRFRTVSYKDCDFYDHRIKDIIIDISSKNFLNYAIKYKDHWGDWDTISIRTWQNFIIKFENGEVVELRRPSNIPNLHRRADTPENRELIKRFKEEIESIISDKPEMTSVDEILF